MEAFLKVSSVLIWLTGVLGLSQSGPWGSSPTQSAVSFLLVLGSMLFLSYSIRKYSNTFLLLIIIGMIGRLMFIHYPMSDDVNRYLWEGRVQLLNENPYLLAPDDSKFTPHRDSLWQGINHKEFTAIYPPATQFIFKQVARAYPSALVWRILLLISEFLALLLIAKVLTLRKMPAHFLGLYALNPFVLIFGIGEAHLDLLLVPLLVGAFYFFAKHENTPQKSSLYNFGILFITLAGSLKYFCWFLFPLFLNRHSLKKIPWLLLGLSPFLLFPIEGVFSSLKAFATDFKFNAPLYSFFEWLPSGPVLLIFIATVLLTLYLLVQPNLLKNAAAFSLFLIVALPTIHPWYFFFPLAFFALRPRMSFLVLQASMALGLLPFYHRYLSTGNWEQTPSDLFWVWFPPAIFWFAEKFYPNLRWFKQSHFAPPQKLSVLLPVYNEEENLARILQQIEIASEGMDAEVLVVDGGSKDLTHNCFEAFKAKNSNSPLQWNWLKSSQGGRGHQLFEACEISQGDWIIIAHADMFLSKGLFLEIRNALETNADCIGGACTMEFFNSEKEKGDLQNSSPTKKPLSFIRGLNSFRNRVLGIAFGDQLQFFRKLPNENLIPDIPLMEDVGLSLNLKKKAQTLHLPYVIKVSDRRWKKVNRLRNIYLIFKLTFLYLVFYRIQRFPKDPLWFYGQYYKA